MRLLKYILFPAAVLLAWSCADDNTTVGGNPISDITIDGSSIQEEYNLAKNDVLSITPVVSQTIGGKELSYEWEVEHETYSNEPVLTYTCTKLGTFNCRLIVSNEDGKSFFPFTINVNTPYEEGLVILSNDAGGNSMMSFMLHHTDGTPDYFYEGDMFSLNNPEVHFSSNISDILISNKSLVISCRGGQSASDPATIYYLNEKTLDIENYVPLADYPDFQPIKMMVTFVAQQGASYPVLSADGKIYEFASTEGTVVQSTKFPSTYDTNSYSFYDGGTGNNFNIFFWDSELGIPVTMDRNSVFYCIADYTEALRRSNVNATNNIFAAGNDKTVAFFIPNFTSRQLLRESPQIYFITSSNGRLRRTVFSKDIWVYDNNTGKNNFDIKQSFSDIGSEADVPFMAGAPMVASHTHKMLFYGIGNKIYQWSYPQTSLASATVFAEVGSSTSVVKAIALSSDHKMLYVASYDPSQSGLNGSCHVIEIEQVASTEEVFSGEKTDYNNVCYEPVKIIYKQK